MRGNVVVESDSEFQKWLQEQTTFAESMANVSKEERSKQVSSAEVKNSEESVSTQ
jgi:heme/copper-type cytochrome/quinol oxidase subunit 2